MLQPASGSCRWHEIGEARRAIAFATSAAVIIAISARSRGADYGQIISETPGLLARYTFDDPAGLGRDECGHDAIIEGEVHSDPSSAYPALGRAIRLSGGWLRVPDLGRHESVSVEFWIRLREIPTGIAAVYAADGWDAGLLHLNLKADGALEVAVNGAGASPNSEPESLRPDKWAHIVAVYDTGAGAVRVYRDGRVLLEQRVSPQPSVLLRAGSVGGWLTPDPSRPLAADLDEFAVYSRALTHGEVVSHYRTGHGIEAVAVDFAAQVRPMLERRCFRCHGPDTGESGLRLDVRDSALLGGESGEPAVVPFDAEGSHLVSLVTATDADMVMPPEGDRLSEAEISLLRNWIDSGAVWPDELAGRLDSPEMPERPTHWSFQPIKTVEPPAADHSFVATGNLVDAFIFGRLCRADLEPSPQADPRTLVRRLYLDVQGLPPTPEEIDRFAGDPSPQAWEELVGRVLESPRYGERWASHWLDVVRYGDTHGFEVNTPRENAWPYRDYVIKSLNEDKPFDRFVAEQIAGDRLGVDSATGFLVAAPALLPGQVGRDEASMRQARADELHEVIVTVGSGVLGLTVGCARCHDHKFDPISQKDYYQLQAVFAGVRYGDRAVGDPNEVRLANGDVAPLAAAVFGGVFAAAGPTYRLYRGDPMQRRERVAPDVPAVLGRLGLEASAAEGERRLALARWLVDPSNPLTPRVIVNRVWQHHFGTGLVETPSDFGAMGGRPSHPELLDALAQWFVKEGWSLKRLHALIVTSNTYRQSSRPTPAGLAVDAESRLLWRFPPRRLDMEPIRDSVLAVSGALDLSAGGPGFLMFKPNDNYVRVYDAKEEWGTADWRRMIYAHRVRMARDGVFGAFDCPDAGQPAPRRSRSTTAIQALNLLNSTFMRQQSDLFAARASREAAGDDEIVRAFRLALGREPQPDELADCRAIANAHGLRTVCLALLNSNEFLFLP